MKKLITFLNALSLMILFTAQSNSQTGCHAGFSFQQVANTTTVNFTDLSTSPNTITSWIWDFGDGGTSTSQNPHHTYNHDGTYTVCLTIHDNHGCSDTYCHHVVVNPVSGNCQAKYSFHQVPNTLTVNFTDLSTSSNTITSWSWDFGDGNSSNLQNPDHTYDHAGTYNVCLTIHDDHGCTHTFCHHFVVNPVNESCHSAFSLHQVPNTLTVNFTDLSTSSNNITSWLWDFGDGTTSDVQNPSHTYAHAGTYNVCLTIHDELGCSSTVCHHITLHNTSPSCHASFTFIIDSTGTVHFTNTSTGVTPNTTYFWNFDDGNTSTDENPTHTYVHTGHYTVCLFIEDTSTGCSSHFCHDVNVNHDHHFHSLGNYSAAQPPYSQDIISNSEKQYILTYPNPVTSTSTIQYELAREGNVTIEIYDFFGNRKERVINEIKSQGIHTQLYNAHNLNTGTYLIKMVSDGEIYEHRFTVLK
jgi:PKD repeat protein